MKKFGLPLWCANLHLRCAAPSISLAPLSVLHAPLSFLITPHVPTSFVLVPQQMTAVNFGHFYCVKLFVKMDRKVTSNIKLKKYKIVNKRSTNSLCTFLTFQTVIIKLINIIIFNAEICLNRPSRPPLDRSQEGRIDSLESPTFSPRLFLLEKVSVHRGCYGLSEIRTFDPRIFV